MMKVFTTSLSVGKSFITFLVLALIFWYIFSTLWIGIVVSFLSVYVSLYFLSAKFIAYEDRLEILFPFRIIDTKYSFELNKVDQLEFYKKISGRFSFPTIKISYQNRNYTFSFAKPPKEEFDQLIDYVGKISNASIKEVG